MEDSSWVFETNGYFPAASTKIQVMIWEHFNRTLIPGLARWFVSAHPHLPSSSE